MTSVPVAPVLRHMNAYFYLRFVSRADEAVAEHRLALQEDPLNLIIRVGLVLSLYSAGRDREATDEGHGLLELAPDFPASYGLQVLNVLTEPPLAARAFAERLHAITPGSAGSVGLLAGVLGGGGDEDRAAALMRDVADPNRPGMQWITPCMSSSAVTPTARLTRWLHWSSSATRFDHGGCRRPLWRDASFVPSLAVVRADDQDARAHELSSP